LQNIDHQPDAPLRHEKMVHAALPVRWTPLNGESRASCQLACTYDIHATGARLVGSGKVTLGDLIMVERGRNKSLCQVTWVGDPSSNLRGQFAVQCVEGKTAWEEDWRQAEEEFQPLHAETLYRPRIEQVTLPSHANRRRRPRFHVEGQAELIDRAQRAAGEVDQISELGARISATDLLRPGTDFRLMLNVFDINLALKARVKYLVSNFGMGVEFQQIRRGDRALLGYVLSRVKESRIEDFVDVEVVGEHAPAASLV
jgi:PilZ domain